eukprot:TRINITY_DN17656_c0_g1_i1.p1 TRINITY_DN17656_c0_g1~~TRINITY_DN17656_c0_g1_i1.p1  ORF type:complete len:861 (+),score=125.19 TRINITY_DN17656_c0_g1_i1:95-2584(+)
MHSRHAAQGHDKKRVWLQRLQLQMGGYFSIINEDSKDAFTINGERFVISALIGEGSFGSVYRCVREVGTHTGGTEQEFAVKIVNTERMCIMNACSEEVVVTRALREAELLSTVGGHPHIVQLHCTAVSNTSLRIFMVMQYIDGVDLFANMLRRRKPFKEPDARKAFSQLLMAVAHCHRRGVAHRDIKLENLMITSPQDFILKLIDFGSARHMMDSTPQHALKTTAKSLTTTSLYTPPDVKRAMQSDGEYDPFKLDSFGTGIVLYAMLCSALPDVTEGTEYENNPKWQQLSLDAKDLIQHLLEPDPLLRYSVADALRHPWLIVPVSRTTSSVGSTSKTLDHELQLLLSSQKLTTALQRERGATCWMICTGKESECQLDWFRKATDECFVKVKEKLQGDDFSALESKIEKLKTEMHQLRALITLSENSSKSSKAQPTDSELPDFETMFGGYSKLTEDSIDVIGGICVAVESPGAEDPSGPSFAWLQIRTLLLVAEQLGRERGFISGHVGKPDSNSFSAKVLVRFAKIQGCRQYLLGSSLPAARCEILSFESGLLPRLRLVERPLLDIEDLKALENAEAAVFEGSAQTSEWFALLTGMIDKVHQHASIAIVNFIQDLTSRTRNITPVSDSSGNSGSLHQQFDGASVGTSSTSTSCYGMNSGSFAVSSTPLHDAPGELFQHDRNAQMEPMRPMKVMSPLGPLEAAPAYQIQATSSPYPTLAALTTPETTPLHQGLWQFALPCPLPPNLQKPPEAPGQVSQSNPSWRSDAVVSRGTIGHPTACRGLGCKFAHKPRGCKEGADCLRCHLCIWQRAPEMAVKRAAAAMPALSTMTL